MQPFFENHKYKKICYDDQYNNDCAPHFHRSIEIIHVLSGSIEMTVRGETKQLFAGDIAISTSYESHSFKTVGSSAQDVFIIPADFVPEFTKQATDMMLTTPFLSGGEKAERISTLLSMLLPYTQTEHSLTAVGYAYAVLGTVVETLGLVPRSGLSQTERILHRILVYSEEHFRENLQISDIAKHFGYHKNYISRIFNKGVGCNFSHYLNVMRLQHAKSLIKKGEMTLDEIAMESGFQSTVTFRRAFTGYYGKSPYQYYRDVHNKK